MDTGIPLTPAASKIVCFGRTFAKHAVELGNEIPREPVFFLKAPSAMIADGAAIQLPAASQEVHYEAEAAIVIGQKIKAVSPEAAYAAIQGWTVLNDVTARDIQRADKGRFTRAKGFDTFCPIASVFVPQLDWAKTYVQCLVNSEQRQYAPLSELLLTPAELVSHASHYMTLMPGDIVSLGTPAGVGPLKNGDVVTAQLVSDSGNILVGVSNPVLGYID